MKTTSSRFSSSYYSSSLVLIGCGRMNIRHRSSTLKLEIEMRHTTFLLHCILFSPLSVCLFPKWRGGERNKQTPPPTLLREAKQKKNLFVSFTASTPLISNDVKKHLSPIFCFFSSCQFSLLFQWRVKNGGEQHKCSRVLCYRRLSW